MPGANQYSPDIPALVLGTGITVLGVMRGLGRARIPQYCLSDRLSFLGASRYCRTLPEPLPPLRQGDDLAAYLSNAPFERAVLIPCSDEWVMASALLAAPLKARFPCSQPSAESLNLLVDKAGLEKLLTRLDLPHPRTVILDSEEDLAALPPEIFDNGFLKPRNSEKFFKTYFVKAFRVQSRDDALRRYRLIREKNLDVVIQQYIPGPSDNHYFIDGFVDRHGRICATFARRRIRMYPPDFGNSSYMTSIPVEEVSGAVDTVARLLPAVSYRGIYSAEFKKDERNGKFCLLEINARPWWYIWFTEISGIPVSEMAYRDALDMDVELVDHYRSGVSLVYPYYDLFACWQLYRSGRMGLFEWAKQWAVARQAVFSLSDPMPSVRWFLGELCRRIWGKR